jgi:hypothetical protein
MTSLRGGGVLRRLTTLGAATVIACGAFKVSCFTCALVSTLAARDAVLASSESLVHVLPELSDSSEFAGVEAWGYTAPAEPPGNALPHSRLELFDAANVELAMYLSDWIGGVFPSWLWLSLLHTCLCTLGLRAAWAVRRLQLPLMDRRPSVRAMLTAASASAVVAMPVLPGTWFAQEMWNEQINVSLDVIRFVFV